MCFEFRVYGLAGQGLVVSREYGIKGVNNKRKIYVYMFLYMCYIYRDCTGIIFPDSPFTSSKATSSKFSACFCPKVQDILPIHAAARNLRNSKVPSVIPKFESELFRSELEVVVDRLLDDLTAQNANKKKLA